MRFMIKDQATKVRRESSKLLAVSIAVVTGLIGANFGASILDYFKIKDPMACGFGIGSAAHGLGIGAIGMTLTSICGTLGASAIRQDVQCWLHRHCW